MYLARVPAKIRTLCWLALLFPVFAMIQVALIQRIPYWKLELKTFIPALPIAGLFTLVLLWLLIRGGRYTKVFYVLMAGTWFALALVRALQGNNAYYGLSLLILSSWLALYGWLLFSAYESPYIDSGQRWFEGAPPTLPRLEAHLESERARSGPYSVARIGTEGVYLLGPLPAPTGTGKKVPLKVEIRFKTQTLQAEGLLIRARVMNRSAESYGVGVQFKDPNRDLQKEIADFVESLRGEGYVS